MRRSLLTAAFTVFIFGGGPLAAAPYGAGYYDTSEYRIGTIAVNIVFPESAGSSENWSTARKNTVVSKIQAAMSWWAARQANAHLSFVYNITTVSTSYEPITCNADPSSVPATSCSEADWIGDVMNNLGYSESDEFEQVYHYNNTARTANGTDWAVTIFVVDSYNDADEQYGRGDRA
jgi:hypothetical protein